jgi:DNA-binding response OmpR family regulator
MRTKVLLVEDDESVHCALSEVLQGEGYEILHAFDGDDALLALSLSQDLGLVLLDLNLAGRNGWDTFERLTAYRPLLPIIIITARSDQHHLAEAAGVGALMEKPLNIPVLLHIIEQLLVQKPVDRLARLVGVTPCMLHPSPEQSGSNPMKPSVSSPKSD